MYIDPWDRMEGETAKNYQYFKRFLDLGRKRTVKQVAAQLNLKVGYIYELSSRFKWNQRVAAWESDDLKLQRVAHYEACKELANEHLKVTKKYRYTADLPLTVLLKRLSNQNGLYPEDIEFLEKLPSGVLFDLVLKSVRPFDTAVKIERLALGVPTEITEPPEDNDPEKMKIYGNIIAENEETVRKFDELLGSIGNAQDSKSGINGISSLKRQL